jgi:hypothetical protein
MMPPPRSKRGTMTGNWRPAFRPVLLSRFGAWQWVSFIELEFHLIDFFTDRLLNERRYFEAQPADVLQFCSQFPEALTRS